jgi:hypothetical protein
MTPKAPQQQPGLRAILLCVPVLALAVTGCASTAEEPLLPPRKENIVAVTVSNQLITFNAGQPAKILSKKAVTGLQPGEDIAGIDYRVAKGVLYALGKTGTTGRLYTIDVASGKATMVGSGPFAVALEGSEFGFDFNPTVDRIRLVSDTGLNARLHPDTGAAVDANPNVEGLQTDGRLTFAASDANAGKAPAVMGAGYTYNKQNDKITTNYAVDGKLDLLVMQGTREGATPAVSPNTGQLFTVGRIGAGEAERVSFDIAGKSSRFYLINLETGAGTFQGTIGGGEAVKGIAIEP